ncbi:MAG: ATP-binding protein [Pseudobdellovibrio sp.]
MSSIITAFLTVIQLSVDYNRGIESIQHQFDIIHQIQLNTVTTDLWEMNDEEIHQQLKDIVSLPEIQLVQIRNGDVTLFQEQAKQISQHKITKVFNLSKVVNGKTEELGEIYLEADLDKITNDLISKAVFIFLSQFFKTLIVSILLYFVFQNMFSQHLLTISNYLAKFDSADSIYPNLQLNRRKRGDEIDQLVDNLNKMKNNLATSYQEARTLNLSLESKVFDNTQTILKQRQQLEYTSKMQALGEMAGGVAHEINTPLSTIIMSGEQLKSYSQGATPDAEKIKNSVERIQKATWKIASIIKSLRFFSRTGQDDDRQETTLNYIITETLELCQSKLNKYEVELIVEDYPPDLKIICNPVHISQVILNLINNSVDAVEHLLEKWIKIQVFNYPNEYEIKITDSGPGIKPELKEKIMTPFFTTKEIGKGTGIGLSISKGLIENHKGKLYIEEGVPHTCFVIRIPKIQTTAPQQKRENV